MGVGRRVERAMGCHLGGDKGAKMGKILVLKVVDEKNQENEKNHFSAKNRCFRLTLKLLIKKVEWSTE